jgi:hypothetical protein
MNHDDQVLWTLRILMLLATLTLTTSVIGIVLTMI